MGNIHEHLLRLTAHLYARFLAPDLESERGDVPGWVLITVMKVA